MPWPIRPQQKGVYSNPIDPVSCILSLRQTDAPRSVCEMPVFCMWMHGLFRPNRFKSRSLHGDLICRGVNPGRLGGRDLPDFGQEVVKYYFMYSSGAQPFSAAGHKLIS